MEKNSNLGDYLISGCNKDPNATALLIPIVENRNLLKEESISFGNLISLVASFQAGLKDEGFKDGDRIIFMMRPSIELYAMLIACFCSGVVPVFIDTGMGKNRILMAVEDSNATAIVAPRALLRLFWILKPLWNLKRYCTDGDLLLCRNLASFRHLANQSDLTVANKGKDDPCLITFTSGSTGRPKGANRTHACLIAQHFALQDAIPFQHNDISLSCFPVAALHQIACGVGTILPRVDLASIADYDPELVFNQIDAQHISMIGTAPAFLTVLVQYLLENGLTVNSIRKIVVGGSTVPSVLVDNAKTVFPNAEVLVIYGSTESEPISCIDSEELKAFDSDDGYLVGKPVDACQVKFLQLTDESVLGEDDIRRLEVEGGEIGELIVAGGHVLKEYIDNPEATMKTKIVCLDGTVWHRTGDLGFFDSEGRIWLVGRDKDVIRVGEGIRFNYVVEQKIDNIANVNRSAVLSINDSVYVVVESIDRNEPQNTDTLLEEIYRVLPETSRVLAVERMPVDGRHNSKVDRQSLKQSIERTELKAINHSSYSTGAIPVSSPTKDGLSSEWQSWQRKVSLAFLLLVIGYTLLHTQETILDSVYLLASVVYIQIPLIFGGVAHMLIVSKDSFSSLKIPINRKLFGANKTWRGVITVPGFSLLGAVFLYPFEWIQNTLFDASLSLGIGLFFLSFVGGIGYVLGELPNSYFKRRLGVAPGKTPEKYAHIFVALDQVDSGIGVSLLYWLVLGIPLHYCLIYLCFFPVVALVVKYYLYQFKLKEVAR